MNGLNWHHDYCVYVGLCDMTNDDSLCEAVRLLCCIAMHVGTDLEFDRSTLTRNPKEMKVLLDPHSASYEATEGFLCVHCTGNIQCSLFHYFKIMTQLHRFPNCREIVLFSICVGE